MERKVVFLILLLVVTAIPTVLFIIGTSLILKFVIDSGGNFQVQWYNNQLKFHSAKGFSMGIANAFLFIALGICVPFFFASIIFLFKEWQTRKKRKAKERVTYRI